MSIHSPKKATSSQATAKTVSKQSKSGPIQQAKHQQGAAEANLLADQLIGANQPSEASQQQTTALEENDRRKKQLLLKEIDGGSREGVGDDEATMSHNAL
ncbi:MAG: hypothetical protein EB116_16685, partial [Betaproteobacteria bacterium]|nr:hypothetical protein [Betaproteobacteria bacterium]